MAADYRVTFFHTAPSGPQPAGSIFIWPTDPNWNDFGYGFRAKARIQPALESDLSESEVMETVTLFVVPWPLNKHFRFNNWLLERAGALSSLEASAVADQFFSILSGVKSYHAVLKACGRSAEQMARVFGPLRDMPYLRWRGLESESLQALLGSDAAAKSLFRNEGAYHAWHQARSLFGHDSTRAIEDARKLIRFSTRLPGFRGPHAIQLDFGVEPPLIDRAHALIGRNGTGKSQLLRELVVEAGLRTDEHRRSPFSNDAPLNGVETVLETQGPLANRVIVMSWDINHEFPRESRLESAFQYFNFLMNEPQSVAGASDRTPLDASETQTAMLLQLLRDDDKDKRMYGRLKRALAPAFKVEKLAVFVDGPTSASSGDWRSLATIMVGNEAQRLSELQRVDIRKPPMRIDDEGRHVPLSSGERSFLNFGIRCTARLTEGSLLILDEPETHLHPNLIADFMRILAILLKEMKSVALIATHSPFVVRELPGRCVHVLRLDDEHQPSIRHAYLRTLGASVDRLAIDIFGDAESPQLNLELAREIAQQYAREGIEAVRHAFGKDLSFEMLSEIRELMAPSAEKDDAENA